MICCQISYRRRNWEANLARHSQFPSINSFRIVCFLLSLHENRRDAETHRSFVCVSAFLSSGDKRDKPRDVAWNFWARHLREVGLRLEDLEGTAKMMDKCGLNVTNVALAIPTIRVVHHGLMISSCDKGPSSQGAMCQDEDRRSFVGYLPWPLDSPAREALTL
jgi:hypothetical protein